MLNHVATAFARRIASISATAMSAIAEPPARFKTSLLGHLCLAVLCASFAAQPASAAAGLRYAYVTDPVGGGGGQILAFSITPATGVLVPLPGACAVMPSPGNGPVAAVVDRTGNFLYVANHTTNSVSLYTITAGTGCLVAAGFFPLAPGGLGPLAITITPHNGCLFVSDNTSGSVDSFTIAPATGFLAPAAGSPFPAGPAPLGIAADPANSNYLYVANNVAAGTITAFTWTPAPGCVLAVAGVTATGAFPSGLAINPAGQFLLVTNAGPGTLTTYPILLGGGGALGVANPPALTGVAPAGVAANPFGDMAFVANSGAATVSSFLLAPAGGAPVVNGPAKATGLAPNGVTIDWTGTYFYVMDSGAGTVHGFKPNVTSGKPGVAFGIFPAGAGPSAMAIQP